MKGGKSKGKSKTATSICYKCGNSGHIARDCRVAVYNLGDATPYDDQTSSWWNEQHYDLTWRHQDLQYQQSLQQQLALPPAPLPQQAQAQAPTEQVHYISGVGNNLLIAAIGHQHGQQESHPDGAELMIDSGAATHVCPQWFAPTATLHPLSKEPGPKLRTSIRDKRQHPAVWIQVGLHADQQRTEHLLRAQRSPTNPVSNTTSRTRIHTAVWRQLTQHSASKGLHSKARPTRQLILPQHEDHDAARQSQAEHRPSR